MQKNFSKRIKKYIMLMVVFTVSSCAPGPPPPIPPHLFSAGIGWIVIGLLIWFALLLCKNFNSSNLNKTEQLTDVLNSINKRLNDLEEKIKQLEINKKP